MKNSETNTPGNSLATSEFRLLRRRQIALEGVLRLQREVEQKADSAAGHDVPEHFCSPRAEPVRHRTQRQNAADGEEHARAVKLRAARPKRVFYSEAKRLFSGTMLPSEGEAPVFRKKAACLQEPLFPPEESRFFLLPFFAPATARATSRARSLLSDCFSRLEPLRSRSSHWKKAASSRFPSSRPRRRGRRAGQGRCCRTAFPGWSRSGTALPAGGKPLLLAALFRAGDGEGDEPGKVAVGLFFPAGAAQEPLFPLEESRFFSPSFFAPVTARATSRARSLLSDCFSRLEPLRNRSSRKKRSACFPEANSLFSGTALPAGGKPLLLAALFRAGDGEGDETGEVVVVGLLFPAGAAQEPLFPPEESRFFSLPFFAPVTARATSRARSLLSDCFSRLEPLRNRSSRRRKAASSRRPFSHLRRRGQRAGQGRCCRTAFPGWSRSGTALPAGGKPLLLAALFRAGDGEGDEPGKVAVGLFFPAGAAQEPLFPLEESRFFSPSFFAPVTARATSRARSLLSDCFSRLEPLRNRSSRRRKAASSRCPFSRR